jgi:hypothetical protein
VANGVVFVINPRFGVNDDDNEDDDDEEDDEQQL